MAGPSETCLILDPGVTPGRFERAAADIGFTHFETRPGDGDRLAYEQVWATPGGTTAVNYLEDPVANLRYISLRGAYLPRFVTGFATRVAVYADEELLDDAVEAANRDDQVRAINRLAVGFVDYDPAAFAVIEAYATQPPDPILREAAVNATGFRAWAEFRPLLERVAATDPAANVRRRAEAILPFIAAGG